MNPSPDACRYPVNLTNINIIEEILIVKAHVIIAFYRLKRSGNVVYKVNVLNVKEDN